LVAKRNDWHPTAGKQKEQAQERQQEQAAKHKIKGASATRNNEQEPVLRSFRFPFSAR